MDLFVILFFLFLAWTISLIVIVLSGLLLIAAVPVKNRFSAKIRSTILPCAKYKKWWTAIIVISALLSIFPAIARYQEASSMFDAVTGFMSYFVLMIYFSWLGASISKLVVKLFLDQLTSFQYMTIITFWWLFLGLMTINVRVLPLLY